MRLLNTKIILDFEVRSETEPVPIGTIFPCNGSGFFRTKKNFSIFEQIST